MAAIPSHGLCCFNSHPRLQTLRPNPSSHSLSSPSPVEEDSEESRLNPATNPNNTNNSSKKEKNPSCFFPKRGQTLELVCQFRAFRGKGLCKVSDTGFVVMCDSALPGESFIGRVTEIKKGNYAEI